VLVDAGWQGRLPWDLARITDVDGQASCCAKPGEEVGADPTTMVSGEEVRR
jgi:hypothetical protein